MDTVTFSRLIAALRGATLAAHEAAALGGDGGASNFDSVVLLPERRHARHDVERAVARAGIRCHWSKNGCVLHDVVPAHYQGEARTRGVRRAAEYLESAGWRATVHYQID